tara:strand:+ start:130 stop:465 length:336 start_codon:yes stop_codon:yes gene_type:complete
MSAATFNMTASQGADFNRKFKLKSGASDVDLSSSSLVAKAKRHHTKTTGDVTFTLTVTNASAGEFKMELTDVQTASMTAGTWNYDLIITGSNGTKDTLIRGTLTVLPGISQ